MNRSTFQVFEDYSYKQSLIINIKATIMEANIKKSQFLPEKRFKRSSQQSRNLILGLNKQPEINALKGSIQLPTQHTLKIKPQQQQFSTASTVSQVSQVSQDSQVNQDLLIILKQKKEEKNQLIFNDDQPFLQSFKEKEKQAKIDLQVRAQRSQVKLAQPSTMPAMCSLIAGGGARTSVDLICVIDVSGSMDGQKISFVKETMNFLIQTLTPSDRLSIITFNDSGYRVCPLRTVNKENIVKFSRQIHSLRAGGGTSISSGMNMAFQTIKDRRMVNTVTSIFLLSDGQDSGADLKIKQALSLQGNQQLGTFSIHSFGFGTDHDEDLMTNIAKLRDGTFYFIKELDTLDEAFCNALGGIISVIATQVSMVVRLSAMDLLKGTKITKVFGDKWQKINEGEYRIELTQLISEVSKDFVFQLTFPAIQAEFGDLGSEHAIIEAFMEATDLQGQIIKGSSRLSITLINQNEEIDQINQNVDVIQNYLRVKAGEVIEESMRKAQANQYEEAQNSLKNMINLIKSETRARKQNTQSLLNDLDLVLMKCRPIVYATEGRKYMSSIGGSIIQQCNVQYSNNSQKVMLESLRSMK